MSLTIAQIAAKAMTAVARAIPDAVHPCALIKTTQGDYDVAAGLYDTSDIELTGRAVLETATPTRMAELPQYVAGPSDQMYLLEGLGAVELNDRLWFGVIGANGKPLTKIIKAVTPDGIGGAGTVFLVVAA